jgi:chaperonin cofactor prefoldin
MSGLIDSLKKKVEKEIETRMTPVVKELEVLHKELSELNKNIKQLNKNIERLLGEKVGK